MSDRLFLLYSIRSSKQGVQINVGKHDGDYDEVVSVVTMHPDDMKEINVPNHSHVRIRNAEGEVVFRCQEGKVPRGLIFVPYGPPTCRLMNGETDGTGMPTSKGWEVSVEPCPAPKGD